ncbi:MAG: NAD-dependent epimerase/dehydratase family protein [Chitinophagales bacterium]
MTYLVTGAAGFIGYYTCRALLERGETVIGLDNLNNYYSPPLKRARVNQLKPYEEFTFFEADLTHLEALDNIFRQKQIDKVCHLAAQAGVRHSIDNPFIYQKYNIEGFLNILEMIRRYEIKNLVYASSSSVYGNNAKVPFSIKDRVDQPVSLYAATKRANELLAYTYHHLYGLKCTGLRFFTVYGPWGRPDMAYFKFTRAILRNEEIEIFNFGNMRRDFTYIDDIIEGVLAALDRNYSFEIFNLGGSEPIALRRLIGYIEKNTGIKARMKYLPMQPGDVKETWADISYSEHKLNYHPKVDIEEGIRRFVQWFQSTGYALLEGD